MDVQKAVQVAREAAEAGAKAAMAFFRSGVKVERKADRSPVTAADRASEAAILEVLRAFSPEATIVTEESGHLPGSTSERWIVDPLDGTRGFTRGGEYWGPLVGLEVDGEVVAGAMVLPVLERTYWAGRGLGSFRNGERLSVSSVSDWSDAVLSLGELPGLLAPSRQPGVSILVGSAYLARCYGDLAGGALVLEGYADAWLEAGVNVWDLAPHKILIEEAGGRFTDFDGRETIEGTTAVGTNGRLHEHVLAALKAGAGHAPT